MSKIYNYSKITIEELFNLYYFLRANMEKAVKCGHSEDNIKSYARDIEIIINEIKNRIN